MASEKASSADNQQGSLSIAKNIDSLYGESKKIKFSQSNDPSETTRQAPILREIQSYFLGALHDGTLSSNGRFRISQKGDEWLKKLQTFLRTIGFSSWIYKEGKTRDIYVLETLAIFLDLHFNPSVLKFSNEKIAYIRGFFDAEGGIPHNPKARFYIQLTQKDKVKLQKIKLILKELGIETGKIHNPSYRVDPDYWRIYILAKSQKDFISKIGSWHPKKISILKNRVVI